MLVPYNVDRPARRTPNVTYGLIAVNVAVYLLTIIYASIKLPSDRAAYNAAIEQQERMQESDFEDEDAANSVGNSVSPSGSPSGVESGGDASGGGAASEGDFGYRLPTAKIFGFGLSGPIKFQNGGIEQPPGQIPQQPPGQVEQPPGSTPEEPPGTNSGVTPGTTAAGAPGADLEKAGDGEKPADIQAEIRQQWVEEHFDDPFVLDPHPATLEALAYHASEPSLLTMLTSMFLHGGFDHLLGNMLFLWVFGRAIEDALGPVVFLVAYLTCGFAAILLYHIMMMQITPAYAAIPAMGASGAIAGILGLFAPRFYRTPVRVFYLNFYGIRIFSIGSIVLGLILARILHLGTPGFELGSLIILGAIVMLGEDSVWGEFKAPAAWLIGGYIVLMNILPALWKMAIREGGGGVAYWAHIGGFLCGMGYAFLIGAKSEGKSEYLIEDARASLDNRYAGNALEKAQELVRLQPDNPAAYQLLAEAYDIKNNESAALDNYELAIQKYLKNGERESAARIYLDALHKHQLFIMPAPVQFVLASQMAANGDHQSAADNLAKIPYTFPEAPEGELSLLRAGQLYIERLGQHEMGLHLLQTFLQRYPDSQYMAQAQRSIQNGQQRLNMPPDPAAQVAAPVPPQSYPTSSTQQTPQRRG